jgi:hypothetical protein
VSRDLRLYLRAVIFAQIVDDDHLPELAMERAGQRDLGNLE